MRAFKLIRFFLVLVLIQTSLVSFSQETVNFEIPLIDRPPTLDDFSGMEPSPAIAAMMARAMDFTQREPSDGDPATQETVVYAAYDSENFYAIFLAFDTEADQVRANFAPREEIQNDDWVGLLIDTFNDQRAAYGFGSSAAGVQSDGRWSDLARGNNGWDGSYEALWYTDSRLTDTGYMVQMTIPLRTLRFPANDEQTWRVQFSRRIPRLSEDSYWPAYSSLIEGRLNQAAVATGVRNVSPGRNMQIVPFVFGRSYDVLDTKATGGPAFNDSSETNIGVDAKLIIQDSLVLDATFNPDFSQVESDEPQVTANERFEVRFPERRPFFLENADYFGETDSVLLFTRRIVDPEVGLRLTGKLGDWGIGTMAMNDEAPGEALSAGDPLAGTSTDINIFRLFRELSDQNRVGVFYSNREFGNAENRVFNVDGSFRLTDNWTTQMQFIDTNANDSLGASTDGSQSNIKFDRQGRSLRIHIHQIDTTEDFQVDLGYQNRNTFADTRSRHTNIGYTFWPENGLVNSWTPRIGINTVVDQKGLRIYENIDYRMEATWDGRTSFLFRSDNMRERLRAQDHSNLNRNKDFNQKQWRAEFATEIFSTFGFSAKLRGGDAINLSPIVGKEPELSDFKISEVGFIWRPSDRLRLDLTYLDTTLEDPLTAVDILSDSIIRAKWNYQFTQEASLRFIVQEENTDPGTLSSLTRKKSMNYDLLVRYVINPWSALYAGYNSNSSNFNLVDTEDGTELVRTSGNLRRDGEQFFVKFSYLLQQ